MTWDLLREMMIPISLSGLDKRFEYVETTIDVPAPFLRPQSRCSTKKYIVIYCFTPSYVYYTPTVHAEARPYKPHTEFASSYYLYLAMSSRHRCAKEQSDRVNNEVFVCVEG